MEKNNLWKAFFLILAALLGFATGEVTDDKINIPILEKKIAQETVTTDCPSAIILAYTADGKKHICECIGGKCPCKDTEKILSMLG